MDKSFEGLLVSVLIHLALALFLIYAKLPPPNENNPVQVTLIEKDENEKEKPHKGKHGYTDLQDLKPEKKQVEPEDPEFLSQFTQKVKKQFQTRNLAPKTQNGRNGRKLQEERRKQVAGATENRDRGELSLRERERQLAMPQQLSQSTSQAYIPGVAFHQFNALNTGQDAYAAFFNRNNPQVGNRWVFGLQGYVALLTAKLHEELARQNRTTVIDAVLTPQGQLFRIDVIRSCGDKGLDEVAVEAFRNAAPFNHPPQGLVEADGFIHYRGGFTVYFRPPSFGLGGNG